MAYPDTVGTLSGAMGTVPPATPGTGTVKVSKEETGGLVMDDRPGQGPTMPVTNDHSDNDTGARDVSKVEKAFNDALTGGQDADSHKPYPVPGPNDRSSTTAEQAEQLIARTNSPNIT